MSKTIYIIRHGQTEYNLLGIAQGGGVDTSLNATGQAQAEAFFEAYGHLSFERVLTSRLKRTHETVGPFRNAGLPWEQFADLNEMGWGDQEGKKTTPETHKIYKSVVEAWQAGDYSAAIPNGESAAQLGQRLERFLRHLRQRPEELLLICSHGRAMRALMCLMKGLPLSEMQSFSHSNTGLWIAQQTVSGFQFTKENDTDHLLQLEHGSWKSLR